jgi:hypothetical protein
VPPGRPNVGGSASISALNGANGTLVITGTSSGVSSVALGNATIFIADKHSALSFWNVHLPSADASIYDRAPDVPSVFVFGPYLVRNATLGGGGGVLALHGDLNTTTTLDVVAPSSVQRITWNGRLVRVQRSSIGTLRGTLGFSSKPPELPDLKLAEWSCTDSLPEIQRGFDDTAWVTANKTNTARLYQPFAGKVSRPLGSVIVR